MMDSSDKSIGKWISILYRQFQIYINRELKEYDINSSEYIYLANIAQNEGENQKSLSDRLKIDKSFTTRVMRNLEQKGYLTRTQNPQDKREYIINLTDKGKEIQPIILEKLQYWTKVLSGDWEMSEVDKIINQLQTMSERATNETKGDKNE